MRHLVEHSEPRRQSFIMASNGRIFHFGVLTVSDTSAESGPSTDASGPLARRTLEAHPSDVFRCLVNDIVPDDSELISQRVKYWVDVLKVDLVITTGGTGFGVRDVTPEALTPLIQRHTPALTHALTSYSLRKTPLAALSRLVTGIRSRDATETTASGPGALIIALPGSVKAVSECLQVLLGTHDMDGVLQHGLELCTGAGSGEETHRQLHGHHALRGGRSIQAGTETDTGRARTDNLGHPPEYKDLHHNSDRDHHHHHHHHAHHSSAHKHHTPVARTTEAEREAASKKFRSHDAAAADALIARARQSPYEVLPLKDALALIASEAPAPSIGSDVVEMPVDASLVGHVLARDAVALRDLPPVPTTNVDGYALRAATNPAGEWSVRTASELAELGRDCEPGYEMVRVNTGQGLPRGTDAVIMVEDTQLSTTRVIDGKVEEGRVRTLATVEAGENVRPEGSDVRKNDRVLKSGTSISPLGGEVGTLAFLGYDRAYVYRKPRVAVLSTGEELQDISSATKPDDTAPAAGDWSHRSFDTNRPSLLTALASLSYPTVDLGIVGDHPPGKLLERVQHGLGEADVLITTGGTSMGESDILKSLIERDLGSGARIHFGRVSMKPGKPTTFATVDQPSDKVGGPSKRKVIFALPGNPASALVCFYVFVLPALRKMSGLPPTAAQGHGSPASWSLPFIDVELAHPMALDTSRPEFHRVIIAPAPGKDGHTRLSATSTGKQRSSGMHSMSAANGLVLLPSMREASQCIKVMPQGAKVQAVLLGSL
ncbi:unnamed protein product [Parajaminaea phylloscopi]